MSQADEIANLAYPDRRRKRGPPTDADDEARLRGREGYARRKEIRNAKASPTLPPHVPKPLEVVNLKAFKNFLGCKDSPTLWSLTRHPETVEAIQAAEKELHAPIAGNHKALQDFQWISEPGTYYGFTDDDSLVLGVRITSPDDITPQQNQAIDTIMEWTTLVNPIKSNAASKHAKGSETKGNFLKTGNMFGLGWHPSMQSGATMATYSPLKGKEIRQRQLEEGPRYLKHVAEIFNTSMATLVPGEFNRLQDIASIHNVPSFDNSRWVGKADNYTGANSMTVTRDGFANYLHIDHDYCDIAYGWWWASSKKKKSSAGRSTKGQFTYHRDPAVDHARIPNGQFLWGEYNIGVDFEKCQGLVEIFWRGQRDYHVTACSEEPCDATRWGTSIQLTKRGVAGVKKLEAHSNPETRIQNSEYYIQSRGLQ